MPINLIPFAYFPNSDFNLKYRFITVLERNKRFVEQRRPVLNAPFHEETAEFLLDRLKEQKFINDLRLGSLQVFAVPIFAEPLHPIGNLQGLTTVSIAENLNEYWNVQTIEVILIKSADGLMELKYLQNLNPNSLVMNPAIINNFQVKTIIYPCFPGIIQSKNIRVITDRIISAQIEFREVSLKWQIA